MSSLSSIIKQNYDKINTKEDLKAIMNNYTNELLDDDIYANEAFKDNTRERLTTQDLKLNNYIDNITNILKYQSNLLDSNTFTNEELHEYSHKNNEVKVNKSLYEKYKDEKTRRVAKVNKKMEIF